MCPGCGAEVRVGSAGCPKCTVTPRKKKRAVVEKKSWEQDEIHDGLNLPDDEFNYEEFLEEEFGGGKKKRGKDFFWWCVAVVLLVAMVLGWVMMVH